MVTAFFLALALAQAPSAAAPDNRQPIVITGTTLSSTQRNLEDCLQRHCPPREDDVGFWVEPSGRVSDIEMLRKGGDSSWAAPLLRSIQGRIYAPLADPAGSYRVERYTYTSLWQSVTGTRLRQRSPAARIEYLDLTAEPSEQSSASPQS
jgi:hypothetical protein